eukprot:TRINITY_DN7503_c0_g1_i1.p2 TRINITY_DN7503_c0_g1~~TRINITY_DN7503_c0_g1_i1.p2  ORF type:complete len:53 (-),score=3.41 TRINITY_DN7503_c0_g1_i1:42-200(-)
MRVQKQKTNKIERLGNCLQYYYNTNRLTNISSFTHTYTHHIHNKKEPSTELT